VKYPIDVTVDREVIRDVVLLELKSGMIDHAVQVGSLSSQEGVETQDLPPLGQKSFAEMGTEKSRAPSDNSSWH
jgi:hypothetical protein